MSDNKETKETQLIDLTVLPESEAIGGLAALQAGLMDNMTGPKKSDIDKEIARIEAEAGEADSVKDKQFTGDTIRFKVRQFTFQETEDDGPFVISDWKPEFSSRLELTPEFTIDSLYDAIRINMDFAKNTIHKHVDFESFTVYRAESLDKKGEGVDPVEVGKFWGDHMYIDIEKPAFFAVRANISGIVEYTGNLPALWKSGIPNNQKPDDEPPPIPTGFSIKHTRKRDIVFCVDFDIDKAHLERDFETFTVYRAEALDDKGQGVNPKEIFRFRGRRKKPKKIVQIELGKFAYCAVCARDYHGNVSLFSEWRLATLSD